MAHLFRNLETTKKRYLLVENKDDQPEDIFSPASPDIVIDDNDYDEDAASFRRPEPKGASGKRFLPPTGSNLSPKKKMATDGPPLVLSRDPPVQVKAELNALLRPYQREGIAFLFERWQRNGGCILGDEMGLGKTVQTLSFISAVRGKWLILAPLTVLNQWSEEAARFGGLRCATLHGNRDAKRAAIASVKGTRADVLLTSYETFETLHDNELCVIEWAGVVLDELHRLKGGPKTKVYNACKAFGCPRRIGLTGTLMQNNLQELFWLVDFVQPGLFGTKSAFDITYVRSIKQGLRRDATGMEVAQARKASKALAEQLGQIYLRRDKSVLAGTLPSKEDVILFCRPTALQMRVYDRILLLPEFERLKASVEPCTCPASGGTLTRRQCCLKDEANELAAGILRAISNLRKVANHLYRLIDVASDSKGEFCKKALAEDLEPIKRMHLEHSMELSGKLAVLANLLPQWKQQGDKVLLFSQSTKMLDIIARFLAKAGYGYCKMDGNIASDKRTAIIETFSRSPEKMVFLMSTRVGGTGLNLTAANVVVIFDPDWNGSNDQQAVDRAYRIGQTRDVRVYRLVAATTIEELMYQRQLYKMQLGNSALHQTHEKRYFEDKDIFGLATLLKAISTNEIILRADRQYEMVKNALADRTDAPPEVLESILSSKFDAIDDNDLDVALGVADAPPMTPVAIAGVAFSHKTTDLLGEDQTERRLAMRAERALEEQQKSVAEKKKEANPAKYESDQAAFIERRRKFELAKTKK